MKKTAGFIRNCIEVYVPLVCFAVLFLVFVFQVFMRYVVRQPQAWTTEVEQTCFLWLVMLGACYAQREKSHVTFTLLYDKLGIRGKAVTTILGNILITFTFLITFLPSVNYIIGLMERQQVTTLLKWPKTIVFFPYVIFLVLILGYAVMEIYECVMVLKGSEAHIQKMIDSSKSEAEQAIENSLAQEQLDLNNIDYEEGVGKK